tara:strand:+ start:79 stop:933 length:855 start_codon:yes stop_codon:yes gene_type:complete
MATKAPYLTGYSIKPYAITSTGEVRFTDGTNNDIRANQVQCQAYGYKYDPVTGTCNAFTPTKRIARNFSNINNKINGPGNTTELGSNLIQINGSSNTAKGLNNNCFINGSNNTIANAVNNATVVGTLAEATATGSIVLGGNSTGDTLGERQSITLMFGTTTTTNATVDSYLNNDGESFFEIPANTIISFQTQTIAIRVGGTAGGGAVGDYKFFIEEGTAVSNRSKAVTVDTTRTTVVNNGTVGVPDVTGTGAVFSQKVTGANNRIIEWVTTMRITQLKVGVDLA